MPLIFNDKRIARIIKDGEEIRTLEYNNTTVFQNHKLTIKNFKGINDTKTVPFYIKSTSLTPIPIFCTGNWETYNDIYIPHGDVVWFDLTEYINYYKVAPETDDGGYMSIEYPTSSSTSVTIGVSDDQLLNNFDGFYFTMDKDITFSYSGPNWSYHLANLKKSGNKRYAEWNIISDVILTNCHANAGYNINV